MSWSNRTVRSRHHRVRNMGDLRVSHARTALNSSMLDGLSGGAKANRRRIVLRTRPAGMSRTVAEPTGLDVRLGAGTSCDQQIAIRRTPVPRLGPWPAPCDG